MMSWVDEWRIMLEHKSRTSLPSYPIDFRTDIYEALREYCFEHGIVYFPIMYEEYITWAGDRDFSPESIDDYAAQSKRIQGQIDEMKTIRDMEQFAKKERIRFYNGDSVIEKVSLVAHYMGLRNGG